jgi:hypothetical protein
LGVKRSRRHVLALSASGLLVVSLGAAAVPARATSAPIRVSQVGTVGNEPLVAVAPDGTIYISALQYMYRSTDHGAHWTSLALPPESGVTEYKTDSSISVDPGGRLYYVFDYPYAGTTAVCTSDDRGSTWSCNPAALPGGTDRMWINAPTKSEAFFTTNEGTEQPIFAHSSDRGATWQIGEFAGSGTNAYTGAPVAGSAGSVLTPVNDGNNVDVDIFPRDGGTPGNDSPEVSTGLPAAFTGPSGGRTPDGTSYVASEAPNQARGRGVVVARSKDLGQHWTKLPELPGSQTGTAIFTALAAGANGHIGVLYYWTPTSVDPNSVPPSAVWYAVYVDSFDANTAHPHWRRTVLQRLHHKGLICRGLGCDLDTSGAVPQHTNYRFAGDFVGAAIGSDGYAYLSWMGADKPPVATPVDPSSNYGVIDFARVPPAAR